MKSRPILLAVSLATVLAALTACSSGTTPAGAPGTGTDTGTGTSVATSAATTACTPVTITYWHTYSAGAEMDALEKTVIPAFEAANPCIKVQDVAVPYDQLHQKLITGTAGGQLPDVVRSDIIWVPELANLGVLEPLDQTMANFQELSQQVFPGPLATNKWKGHYFGLPLDTNCLTLLYNKESFASWGVTVPKTWDDLKVAASSLKAQGVYAYADNDLSGWNVLPIIWSFGGSMTDDAVTKATGHLNSPQTVAAIQYFYDMYQAGYIPTNITQKQDVNAGFATGQFAAIPGGPWMFPILGAQYPDFTLSTTAIPSGPGGSISVVGGENIVMTSAGQHKDAAAAFITYALSEQAQMAMAQAGQMTVLSSLNNQMTSIQPYYADFLTQLATARPRPATPAWTQIDQLLESNLQQLFINKGDVQQTMDSLASQVDALLAQYA